jgi:hypothetical protein
MLSAILTTGVGDVHRLRAIVLRLLSVPTAVTNDESRPTP